MQGGDREAKQTSRGLARRLAWAGLLLGCALAAAPASAQDVEVQVGRGPHYVGESIVVQVVAHGFEEDPTPTIEAPAVEGGTLRFAGVSPSVSSSISIINGKMSRSKEVRFVYRYDLVATREGRVEVPGFRVSQGATTHTTRGLRVDVKGVPTTGLVELSVEVPEGPIFVGQKVPIELVLRIDRQAERDLLSLTTSVPLFDVPTLRFLDEPRDAEGSLEVQTAEGTISLPADIEEEQVGGRTVLVLRAKRTMIATSPEPVRAAAPRAVISRGTRFRRDLFGQRQATSTERLMSRGRPVEFEVIEVPREGRPPTFAGAVGEGFTLEVNADRSVVQLGEPIVLRFLLRGDGDLTSAGLPPFDAPGFFDPEQFRLPEEPPAGLIDESGKHFEVSLRVLDAGVREIPALEYTWFDAETRRFETTRTRPIALSVGAAEIIGAEDVDRRDDSAGTGAASGEDIALRRAAEGRPRGETERRDSFAASGANLAIETRPEVVLGAGARASRRSLTIPAVYVLSLAILGFAAFDARRRARDPRDVARAAAFAAARRGLASDESSGDPGQLGRILRALVAAVPSAADDEFDALIEACDALRFAPGGERATVPAELRERARRFVDAAEAGAGGPS